MDDLIENNRRRVEVLEEMARAIYREWFVHFRFPGHEDATFVDSDSDSDLGPIPEGWEASTVGALVVQRRETVSPNQVGAECPLVGLEHMPRRRLTLADWGAAEGVGSRKAPFRAGDLLFGKIRPYFHKVVVAPLAGVCSTDALVLGPVGIHRGQAIMTLSGDELVALATQTSNGTKMPRANWEIMSAHPVPIPPDGLAERFTKQVDEILDLCVSLMFRTRTLVSIRDLLLPKLVTGQIDVSDLDLDAVVERAVG